MVKFLGFVVVLMLGFAVGVEAATSKATLSWSDNSTNEDGFEVERGSAVAGPFNNVGKVGPSISSYVDQGLVEKTTYCYRVRAFNSGGNSAYSNVACGTTQQSPPDGAPGGLSVVFTTTP